MACAARDDCVEASRSEPGEAVQRGEGLRGVAPYVAGPDVDDEVCRLVPGGGIRAVECDPIGDSQLGRAQAGSFTVAGVALHTVTGDTVGLTQPQEQLAVAAAQVQGSPARPGGGQPSDQVRYPLLAERSVVSQVGRSGGEVRLEILVSHRHTVSAVSYPALDFRAGHRGA